MIESAQDSASAAADQADAPASACPVDDMPLLKLCAEFHAQQARLFALLKITDAEDGNEAEKANDKWNDLLDEIGETPAKTIRGLIAKAEISSMLIRGFEGDPEKEWMDHQHFIPLTLAEDLVAFGYSQAAG
jgi:hypothetical protein